MPNFFSSVTSIAELAHGEKSRIQSPSLFDALGTEVLALREMAMRQASTVQVNTYMSIIGSDSDSFTRQPSSNGTNTSWTSDTTSICGCDREPYNNKGTPVKNNTNIHTHELRQTGTAATAKKHSINTKVKQSHT